MISARRDAAGDWIVPRELMRCVVDVAAVTLGEVMVGRGVSVFGNPGLTY